jgi:hypothetical protein
LRQLAEITKEGDYSDHHDGAFDGRDVCHLARPPVGFQVGEDAQRHHRVAQNCGRKLPSVYVLGVRAHTFHFLDRMAEHWQVGVTEKRHPGFKRLSDHVREFIE